MSCIRFTQCEAPLGCSIARGFSIFGEFYACEAAGRHHWTATYAEALAWCEAR